VRTHSALQMRATTGPERVNDCETPGVMRLVSNRV
jgi:hypothetical protein